MTERGWGKLARAARLVSMFGALAMMMTIAGEAAELRGRLLEAGAHQAPRDTRVAVDCPKENFRQEGSVGGDGNYSVRGIPTGASCTLKVRVGKMESKPIDFMADQPVVRFSGEVRVIKGKVIVLRKG